MPTVNINGTIRHWDYIEMFFVWTSGGDDHLVHHWIENTLSIEDGGYERHDIEFDGQTMVTDRRQGKPKPSMVKFSVKRSDLMGADELYERMLAVATAADGFVPKFDFYIIGYDNRGATVGEKILYENCIFEGGFSASHGQQFDTVPVSIVSPQPQATVSAVT